MVPAIVQDAMSKEVLMLAYMNRESLRCRWKRARPGSGAVRAASCGIKGQPAGIRSALCRMHYDCDGDTLLVRVEQMGPACHTGHLQLLHERSSRALQVQLKQAKLRIAAIQRPFAMLNQLEASSLQRYAERPEGAYTTYLFEKGVDKILKKVGEETAEVIIAAKNQRQ